MATQDHPERNKWIRKFAWQMLVMTLIVGAFAFGAQYVLPERYITIYVPVLLAFFYFFTLIVHFFLLRASDYQARRFVGYFMLATILKFIVYLAIIFIFVYIKRQDTIPFVLTFFTFYVLYTIFEVVAIVKYQGEQEKKQP